MKTSVIAFIALLAFAAGTEARSLLQGAKVKCTMVGCVECIPLIGGKKCHICDETAGYVLKEASGQCGEYRVHSIGGLHYRLWVHIHLPVLKAVVDLAAGLGSGGYSTDVLIWTAVHT